MATIREAFVTEAIAVTPSPTKKLLNLFPFFGTGFLKGEGMKPTTG